MHNMGHVCRIVSNCEEEIIMKCFYHPGNEAIATSSNCNKGLCPDCTSHLPFCTDCYLAEVRVKKRKISIFSPGGIC